MKLKLLRYFSIIIIIAGAYFNEYIFGKIFINEISYFELLFVFITLSPVCFFISLFSVNINLLPPYFNNEKIDSIYKNIDKLPFYYLFFSVSTLLTGLIKYEKIFFITYISFTVFLSSLAGNFVRNTKISGK